MPQNNLATGHGRGFFQGPGGPRRKAALGQGGGGRDDGFQLKNLSQTVELANGRFQFDIRSEMGVDSPDHDPHPAGPHRRAAKSKDFGAQDQDPQNTIYAEKDQGAQRSQADRKQFLVSSMPQMNTLDGSGMRQGSGLHAPGHPANARRMPPLGQTHKTVISVQQSNAPSNAKDSLGPRPPAGSTGSHAGPSAIGGGSVGKRNAFMGAPYPNVAPEEYGGLVDDHIGLAPLPGPGKPRAPLHQFLLGDFQLQSWRTLKQ